MATTAAEHDAMRRALELAALPGRPLGANPRVGCVLLDAAGSVVGEGHHRGPGTAHAEVDALSGAGDRARGATAVVTLEPCHHTGRTGPCTAALLRAGVRRVVLAQADPNPVATGGAEALRAAGVEVETGLMADQAHALNRVWSTAVSRGRPFVTWKLATTLDGRSAARDLTSRWITGPAARRDVHRLRALVDAVVVGTGTVEADDPALSVRDEHDRPVGSQPLRVVVGQRALDPDRRVHQGPGATHLRTRDPHAALAQLHALQVRHVLLEGGPTVGAAWLRAGVVDELVAYVAPVLLGAGVPAVGDLGIATLAEALRPRVTDVTVLGADQHDRQHDRRHDGQLDVRLTLEPAPADPPPSRPPAHPAGPTQQER